MPCQGYSENKEAVAETIENNVRSSSSTTARQPEVLREDV